MLSSPLHFFLASLCIGEPCYEHDSCSLPSILYKTKLPFIIVFNKTDVQPHDFALEWMQDFEVFQEALATHQSTTDDDGAPTYMNSLMNSMSLVLDEFYKHLKVGPRGFSFSLQTSLSQSVGVSSMTGDGVAEFFQAVEASREEYERSIPFVLVFAIGHLTCPTLRIGNISPNLRAYVRSAKRHCRNKKRTLRRGCWPTSQWTAQVTPTLQRGTVGTLMRKRRRKMVGS